MNVVEEEETWGLVVEVVVKMGSFVVSGVLEGEEERKGKRGMGFRGVAEWWRGERIGMREEATAMVLEVLIEWWLENHPKGVDIILPTVRD